MINMRGAPPPIADLLSHAIFLDLDGTLADIAPRPSMATVPHPTVEALSRLSKRLDGALAVVSGRQLEEIDGLIGLSGLAAAGIHGAQLRTADGLTVLDSRLAAQISDIESKLVGRLGRDVGIMLERKPLSVAVHYRADPSRHEELEMLAADLVRDQPGLKYLTGKRVIEILPASADKGKAIRQFMQVVPFRGRVPVFAGDDVTDEDGFDVVNALGGISIKIGDGPTKAEYGFASVLHFREWLGRVALS